ncbi:MAG: hypothetical protein H0V66_01740, partial [Bdellovibrionales bacterium]|nr:hypothetical protein [Bdellovibrionales bacterium]
MLRPEANDYQYLFLGGIMGELLSLPFVGNYLKVNRKILRGLGVKDIECMTLNSYKSACENSNTLVTLIDRLYKKNKKPLVIMGHSKACLELVIGMIDHLPVFQEKVKKVICVQPPFQGSSVFEKYDFLKHANPIWPGLKCLEANHYSDLFAEKLIPNPEAQDYMRHHLLVIRGFKANSRNVSWIIRPSHFVMKRTGSHNDGLVKLKDQIIPFAEYREIVMDMDHSDMFTSTLLSTRSDDYRKKVMSDLIN